jgi:polyribonucleotide 5'-hydroxyl-kinase
LLISLVNTILVLGSERLHIEMQKRFSGHRTSTGETITHVKLDKSGGCVDRDDTFMQQTQEAAIKEYFFGDTKSTLSPHTQQMGFDDVTIYKIKEGSFNSSLFLSMLTHPQPMRCHSCQVGWRKKQVLCTKRLSRVR